MVEGNQATENRFLPNRQADPVTVLERESRFFIGKAEFLCLGPKLNDVRRRDSRLYNADGGIHVVPAAFVSVPHSRRGAADGKGPVIASTVAVIAVQYVEEGGVAGAQDAVRIHVRMRAAALAGDGVDAFHMLRAQIVEHFADDSHAFVFP